MKIFQDSYLWEKVPFFCLLPLSFLSPLSLFLSFLSFLFSPPSCLFLRPSTPSL